MAVARAVRNTDSFSRLNRSAPIGGGQKEAAERADAGSLRRRRQTEQDGAEHGDDQQREREERSQQRPDHLGERNIGLLLRQLGGQRRD